MPLPLQGLDHLIGGDRRPFPDGFHDDQLCVGNPRQGPGATICLHINPTNVVFVSYGRKRCKRKIGAVVAIWGRAPFPAATTDADRRHEREREAPIRIRIAHCSHTGGSETGTCLAGRRREVAQISKSACIAGFQPADASAPPKPRDWGRSADWKSAIRQVWKRWKPATFKGALNTYGSRQNLHAGSVRYVA